MKRSNKTDAQNPARPSCLHSRRHWRGTGEAGRSANSMAAIQLFKDPVTFHLPPFRTIARMRAGVRISVGPLILATCLWCSPTQAADYLFLANSGTGEIYRFAPDGARSTFASGLAGP